MAKVKFTISDAFKKTLRISVYLLVSGVLGYVLAEYVAKEPALTAVFTPVINFLLYSIAEELKNQGYLRAIRG